MVERPHLENRPFPPCCPELTREPACDVIDFHYRLVHNTRVSANDQVQNVAVEVILHVRLERCSGPLALGDLVYTTTLLPGEKVRLFTADRRTRFTFDSETGLSYRHSQTQEEQFYLTAMSDFMSDVTVRDEGGSSNQSHGSTEGHAETSGALESLFGSPSVDASGSYNAESTSEFARELRQHAEASHHRSENATRTASSTSVGEVQTRAHAEGSTEDHYESASRVFENRNRCHAVTFYFYRINKTQVVRLTLEAIRRRVIDPAGETKVTNNAFVSRGGVTALPSAVLATDENRLEVEAAARASVAAQYTQAVPAAAPPVQRVAGVYPAVARAAVAHKTEPLSAAVRRQALRQVDEELVAAGLLDRVGGEASSEFRQEFRAEFKSSLPTPGVMVRGCLDECDVCEPALHRQIELELDRMELQNKLLARQIELLEKAQEYRCCPEGSTESTSTEPPTP